MSLQEHLAAAAVEDGDVPLEVAEWVDAGARPDLADLDEDSAAAKAKRWEITDQGAATWAMRKLAAAKAAQMQILTDYLAEKKRLDRWLDRAQRPHANTVAFMQDRLERWALRQREANPRQATFHTPAGSVETRVPSKPWTVEVADKEMLLRWALANQRDDLIRPTLQPVTEIRKRVAIASSECRECDGAGVVPHTGRGSDGFDACEACSAGREIVAIVDAETGEIVPGLSAEPTRPTVIVRPEVTE